MRKENAHLPPFCKITFAALLKESFFSCFTPEQIATLDRMDMYTRLVLGSDYVDSLTDTTLSKKTLIRAREQPNSMVRDLVGDHSRPTSESDEDLCHM